MGLFSHDDPADPAELDVPTLEITVEIPEGSRNKYEYDAERDRIVLDRVLHSSVHYPADYGYIEDTLARDGDPLDALVLLGEPTFPGCLVEARPVGVFQMTDEAGPDAKILCVPLDDPQWNHVDTLHDVPPHLLEEVEHFFETYKDLEEKKTSTDGWDGLETALDAIEDSRDRFHQP